MLADSITAFDKNGAVVAALRYFDPSADVVAGLTDFFGFEPVVTVVPRRPSDAFAGTRYIWDGFTLSWRGFEDELGTGIGQPPFWATMNVRFDARDVRGIPLEGPSGVRVGDPIDPLIESYSDGYVDYTDADGLRYRSITIGIVSLPVEGDNPGDWVNGMFAASEGPDGLVTVIGGPTTNYGL